MVLVASRTPLFWLHLVHHHHSPRPHHGLGDKNPKWKKWWQIVQEFIQEQIQENMELAIVDEHVY
jgi:hypothetical protein